MKGSNTEAYSKALITLSIEDKQLFERDQKLKEFVEMIKQIPNLNKFLQHPEIDEEFKQELLIKILKDHHLVNFILLVLERKKFKFFSKIAESYHRHASERAQEMEGFVITATPLDSSLKERLIKKLEDKFKKRVRLCEEIDPTIIGGGILIVGNQMIDFSVKGRLEKLKAFIER